MDGDAPQEKTWHGRQNEQQNAIQGANKVLLMSRYKRSSVWWYPFAPFHLTSGLLSQHQLHKCSYANVLASGILSRPCHYPTLCDVLYVHTARACLSAFCFSRSTCKEHHCVAKVNVFLFIWSNILWLLFCMQPVAAGCIIAGSAAMPLMQCWVNPPGVISTAQRGLKLKTLRF